VLRLPDRLIRMLHSIDDRFTGDGDPDDPLAPSY
jgi:hypothetical protein